MSERQLDGGLARSVERMARWWTSASSEERYALLRASCKGDPEAPKLDALQIAIYLAEAEAGQVSEG